MTPSTITRWRLDSEIQRTLTCGKMPRLDSLTYRVQMGRKNGCRIIASDGFPAIGRRILRASIPYRRTLRLLTLFSLSCVFLETVHGQAPSGDASTTFEALVKSAAAARESGRASDAIRDYQRALEIRPDWGEGWWYLGTLQYDSDQYSEAIPSFQKLVQFVPGAGPGWSFLGLCEFETKDFANSLEHLRKGQSLGDGDDPEIARVSKYHLALLLVRNGNFEEATSLLAASFGQSQMSAQVQVTLGLALLRVPLLPDEVDPSQDALVHAAGEAAARLAQNDTAKALEEFPSLLKDYPDVPYIHYGYARALISADRVEDAVRQLREEARISPQSAFVQAELSQLLLRMRHPQEAVRAAAEAVRLAPDSSGAHLALGQAFRAAGKGERSAQELTAAK